MVAFAQTPYIYNPKRLMIEIQLKLIHIKTNQIKQFNLPETEQET